MRKIHALSLTTTFVNLQLYAESLNSQLEIYSKKYALSAMRDAIIQGLDKSATFEHLSHNHFFLSTAFEIAIGNTFSIT